MLYKHMQPAALTAKIALMHEWLQTFTKVLLTNNLLFDLRVCVGGGVSIWIWFLKARVIWKYSNNLFSFKRFCI